MTVQTSAVVRTLECVAPASPDLLFTIPHIPELESVARRIDADDERELRRYLQQPALAVLTGSSGFGGQLDRAAAYGYGALPCRRCGGSWRRRIRSKDGERVVGWKDGSGWAPKRRFGKRETYATALARYRKEQARLHRIVIGTYPTPSEESGIDAAQLWESLRETYDARGEHLMTETDFRQLYDRLPDEVCVRCEACDGMGVVPRRAPAHVEVTCWPKGSSVGQGSPNGDHMVHLSTDLHDHLMVEVLLQKVAQVSPIARAALEGYYGPSAHRDGRPKKAAWEGLHELTSAGNEPETTRGPKAAWEARRARQAAELYDHACRCWNWANASEGEPEEPSEYDDDDEAPSGVYSVGLGSRQDQAASFLALEAAGGDA